MTDKLTEHWMQTALSRIRAGEPEQDVMHDYGYYYCDELDPGGCEGCGYLKGRHCMLSANHCTRRAIDMHTGESNADT